MQLVPIYVISIFFICGGVGHFVAADAFISAMPAYLPYHRELVYISGVFELLGAIGILVPRTRFFSGYGLIALCIAVFPANINMALHSGQFPDFPLFILYLRLPLQIVIIGFILWAIKRANIKA